MNHAGCTHFARAFAALTAVALLVPSATFAQHLSTGHTSATGNTAPALDLNGPDSGIDRPNAVFTAGGGPVLVTEADATVADPDGRYLLSATVQITNNLNAGSETLAATVAGTGLTASLGSPGSSRTLTITGLATEAIYQQVLRTVTYNNTATSGLNSTPRTIFVRVNDGQLQSSVARTTLYIDTPGPCSITCPSSVTTGTAAGRCDANVNFNPPVTTGTCGGVNLSHASGSVFPRGVTTVTASSASSGASCSFTVTVNDTAGPSLSCPAPIVVSNTPGQCGAVVNFNVTATDNCPGVTTSADPPSGSTFPVGTTNVTAGATDAASNINFCIFGVTVNDTEPPAVTCPGNITVQAPPGAQSAPVNFNTSATDNCAGVNVQANPPSGSDFSIGNTTVTMTATDAKGNTATCSFTVTVTPPAPATLANISTRLRVETGDNALIGGFIITGTQPKKVIVRGIGTSLSLPDKLADPTMELHGPNGLIEANDNWVDSPNKQAIIDSTIPPASNFESAIVQTLPANNAGYTAIVRGVNNSTGIGVIEAYDLDTAADSRLANISTRGLVQTGDNVLIAGTIVVGSGSQRVLIRGIGPSLAIPGQMENPTLELRDSNGALLQANDNWIDSPDKQATIDTTIPPTNDAESAILATLPANASSYTAIVRGVNNTTGIAVVEIYALN